MNTDYLRTFVDLAYTRSFTKTAANQALVQSTVSSRIQELEKEIGKSLFNRTKNYVELTLAGKCFFEYAEKIISLEEMAIDQVNISSAFTERLHIDFSFYFSERFLNMYLRRFLSMYSDVSVHITHGHSKSILSRLIKGWCDVGFMHHEYRHPGFECQLVHTDEIVFVCAAQYQDHRHGVTRDILNQLRIYYSNYLYTTTRDWLFQKGVQFQVDVDIGSKIIPHLLDTECYTFLPKGLIKEPLDQGLLRIIPILDTTLPLQEAYMVYRMENQKSASIKKWLHMMNSCP